MRIVNAMPLLVLVAGPLVAGDANRYPHLDQSDDRGGRELWLEHCEGCHGYGIGGAPIPMEPADWEARLAKGRETLYRHAIDGFFGPDDSMMPPRGGIETLSDMQVKAAVDYMADLASLHLQRQRGSK